MKLLCSVNTHYFWYIILYNCRKFINYDLTIGEGNYSKIFLASLRQNPEIKVAIKCISKNKAFGGIEHLRTEVSKLIQTDHPNVIRYHELYEDKRTIFIVMEYEKGELLFNVLTKLSEDKGTFNEYETAIIIKKLLQTVEYLHKNKVRLLKTKFEDIGLKA